MYNTHITSTSTQKVTSKANIFTLPNELLEPILSYAADATTALELDTIQEHTHIQRWKDIALTCRQFYQTARTSKRVPAENVIPQWGHRTEEWDTCTHFDGVLQYTGRRSNDPYPRDSAIIVTDIFSFFLGTNDLSLVQNWIHDKYNKRPDWTKVKTDWNDPDRDYYPHGWCPPDVWNSFLKSSRNKTAKHLVIPMVRIDGERGSEKETQYQDGYARNSQVVLCELLHLAMGEAWTAREAGSDAAEPAILPNLISVIVPSQKDLCIKDEGEVPDILDTHYTGCGYSTSRYRLENYVQNAVFRLNTNPKRIDKVQMSTSHDPCVTNPYVSYDSDDSLWGWRTDI